MTVIVPEVPVEEVILASTEKQPSGAKKWSFTHNLEKDNIDMCKLELKLVPILKKLNSICKYFIFSLEKVSRYHLQGYIELKEKIRITGLKRIFDDKTHWEKSKGSKTDNYLYCTKDAIKVWEKKDDDYTDEELGILKETDLFDWQKDIIDIVSNKPEKRHIYWYYSKLYGGIGKSEFCKYLIRKYNAHLIGGDKKDIMTQILGSKGEKRISNLYVYNIAKACKGLSYTALEDIKDGLITSTKYEGCSKVIPIPHIIVFSNFEPDYKKMMPDRFIVRRLDYGPENQIRDFIED